MRFVFVLEDDEKLMREIAEALLRVDPEVQVRQFKKIDEFVAWLRVLVANGTDAVKNGGQPPDGVKFELVPEGEPAVLQMVISQVEMLGARQLGLMKRTRDLFVRHGLCTHEDPTTFVLTAFEDPKFKIEDLKDRILSNILMKPFDRLILEQDLTFALEGRHPPSKNAVAAYKTKARIEVLKQVELETLSPIGFTTRSNRALPEGAVSKYYGKIFTSERHRSLMGRLNSCGPHPKIPGEFEARFTFFGADHSQILSLRRQVLTKIQPRKHGGPVDAISEGPRCRILVLDDSDETALSLHETFSRRVQNAEIIRFHDLPEFLFELDPQIDADGKGIKALPTGSLNFDLDLKGTVISMETPGLAVLGQPMKVGDSVLNLGRGSELAPFLGWLAAPKGDFFALWRHGERSFLTKLTHQDGRKFQVVEASAQEKENFARMNSRLREGWDFLFVSHRFSGVERIDLWKEIMKRARGFTTNRRFHVFMTAKTEYKDDEERLLASVFEDLFFLPLDKLYILQKMRNLIPELVMLEEPVEIPEIFASLQIKSARPVEIEELSEAGPVLKYDRTMSLGSFREFVLWQPYEVGAPEITATCNFAEPSGEPNEFKLHFVFFAMKDQILKKIRSWIMENYVNAKNAGH